MSEKLPPPSFQWDGFMEPPVSQREEEPTPRTDALLALIRQYPREDFDPHKMVAATEYAALEKKLAATEKERDAALRDAERYRWLRDGGSPGAYTSWQDEGGSWEGAPLIGDRLDAAIDAALAEKGKP